MSHNKNPRRYQRRSPDFWLDTIDRWQASGLTQKRFCDDHKLAIATFQFWRRRLTKQGGGAPPPQDPPAESGFVAVEVTAHGRHDEDASHPIEILLPSGVRLQVPPHCSGHSLAEVLWALQAVGPC